VKYTLSLHDALPICVSTDLLTDIKETLLETINSDAPDAVKLDALKANGENSSAKIVSAYLNKIGLSATYLNPKDAGIIVSNEPGNAQILPESFAKIHTLRERDDILVIHGFFGYSKDGQLTTF